MFIIKKLLTPLSSPYFVALLLLLVGLGLAWFSKRQKLARLLLTGGVGLLLVFSYDPVIDLFLRPLERSSPPLLSPGRTDLKWIVVLGAGHRTDATQPPNNQLNGAALARVVEGVRHLGLQPQAKLVLSGGAVWDETSQGEMLARTAQILGVPRSRMVVEGESRDTVDEARLLRPLIGTEPFVMVTSASHMPRAMRLFEKEGMKPIAAPTDMRTAPGNGLDPTDLFPAPTRLVNGDVAFHEYAGMLFGKLRGQM